jgi:hypothetical protein
MLQPPCRPWGNQHCCAKDHDLRAFAPALPDTGTEWQHLILTLPTMLILTLPTMLNAPPQPKGA